VLKLTIASRAVLLLASVLLITSCDKSTEEGKENESPNVVFILADDLGWTDLGFMTFSRAYSNAPNCAPTRASLMSGLYTPQHEIITVASSERGKSKDRKLIPIQNKLTLDSSFKTMGELFQDAGYRTGHVGKWHLGMGEHSPKEQGFEYHVAGWEGDHKRTFYSPNEVYLTDSLASRAIEFVDAYQSDKRPFFLYMSFHTVHTPIEARADLLARFQDLEGDEYHNNPDYAAMVAALDENVGRILTAIDEQGVAHETMIVFMSDNGGHATYTLNTPLRGSKGMLYEGGVRVPLVVRWPGKVKSGSKSSEPVISLDFMPTFLDLTKSEWGQDYALQGESLLDHLQFRKSLERDYLYWHFPAYLEIYRRLPGTWRITPMGSIVKGDWKLMEFFEDGHFELYNLAEDLSEEKNILDNHPDLVSELKQEMQEWRAKVGARVPETLNPDYLAE